MSEMSREEWQRGYDNMYRWKWGEPYFDTQRVTCTNTWTHRIEYIVLYPGDEYYPDPPIRAHRLGPQTRKPVTTAHQNFPRDAEAPEGAGDPSRNSIERTSTGRTRGILPTG